MRTLPFQADKCFRPRKPAARRHAKCLVGSITANTHVHRAQVRGLHIFRLHTVMAQLSIIADIDLSDRVRKIRTDAKTIMMLDQRRLTILLHDDQVARIIGHRPICQAGNKHHLDRCLDNHALAHPDNDPAIHHCCVQGQ